jgi:hypothetical protein
MTNFADAINMTNKPSRAKAATEAYSNLYGNGAFSNAVKTVQDTKEVRTTNGLNAWDNTSSKVLDLFSKIGSARKVDLSKDFVAAMAENEDLAVRTLLWARDIREGSGERSTFRKLLAILESYNPSLAGRIMAKIPELGRWDDLFVYSDPLNRRKAKDMIANALREGNGLAAKWMPRKGPVAVEMTKFLGLSPKAYRKLVVHLTSVVETQMCAKNWNEINFSHVPSVASARYQKAFGRNAKEAYSAYIAELKKPVELRDPKVKINAAAVYPYDVVKSVVAGNAAVADAQWDALPNYVGDASILPLVDVSGSMGSLTYTSGAFPMPIHVAVSLGLYLSSKNVGKFKDLFLTFSGEPEFVNVKGTLSQKMRQMETSKWEMNTDFNKALKKILDLAVRHNIPKHEMPQMLLVLSDMQFDAATSYHNSYIKFDPKANDLVRDAYLRAGYNVPKIVYWNLNGSTKNTPVKFNDRDVASVSGFSPAIMKSILSSKLEKFTPYNVMLETLNKSRYDF